MSLDMHFERNALQQHRSESRTLHLSQYRVQEIAGAHSEANEVYVGWLLVAWPAAWLVAWLAAWLPGTWVSSSFSSSPSSFFWAPKPPKRARRRVLGAVSLVQAPVVPRW